MNEMSKINTMKFGIDRYMTPDEYLDLLSKNGAREDQEKIDEINRQTAVMEAAMQQDAIMTGIMQHKAARNNAIMNIDQVYNEGKNTIFKSILCEAFIQSLPLDNYFVNEHTSQLSAVLCDYVEEQGGFAMLETAVKKHGKNVPFLKRLHDTCVTVAREASTRILREGMDDPDLNVGNIFTLNDEEKQKLNDKKETLSLDRIGKNIKEKVTSVVKSEVERNEKRQELMEDLAKAGESTKVITEAAELARGDYNPVYESTLYNALLTKNLRNAIGAIQAVTEASTSDGDPKDDVGDQIIGTTDDLPEPMKNDVNMDLVMCESLVDFTILELSRTIRLEDFSTAGIRETVGALMK